ncbi:MAG: serine/threonine-protein kinase [Myxococcota bacterium]|nr:serine/threonine-protein kinase [Myxococcota bacterium]
MADHRTLHQGTSERLGELVNGKYELQEQIGAGAHGTVYRALQHPVGRTVALKFISKHLSSDPDNRVRFFHEARVLARLSHPSVVTLFDYGEMNGQLFMVLEYVNGQELTELIRNEGPLDPIRAINIAEQILRALVETHEIGLVHRDLKPANIMVGRASTGEDLVKILDFGIASLRNERSAQSLFTHPQALGTPGYCAPEQCLGHAVGPSADLYALGVILFEMVSGHAPYRAANAWMMLERHINEAVPMLPRNLSVPAGLESTIRLAMAKKPEARFPDARSMLRKLLEVLNEQATSTERSMPTLRDIPVLRLQEHALACVQENAPSQSDDSVDIYDVLSFQLESPRLGIPSEGLAQQSDDDAGHLQLREWTRSALWISMTLNGTLILAIALMVTIISKHA